MKLQSKNVHWVYPHWQLFNLLLKDSCKDQTGDMKKQAATFKDNRQNNWLIAFYSEILQ